jgi:hypothetical protein
MPSAPFVRPGRAGGFGRVRLALRVGMFSPVGTDAGRPTRDGQPFLFRSLAVLGSSLILRCSSGTGAFWRFRSG